MGELLSKDATTPSQYKAKLLGLPEPGSAGSRDSATASAKHVDVIELRLHLRGEPRR